MTLVNACGGKYIRAAVTPVNDAGMKGETVYSNSYLVTEALGPAGRHGAIENYRLNTAAEDVFSVNGKQFILLDRETSGNYFVLAKDYYGGEIAFDKASNYQSFDPERQGNIGYYLNHTLLESSELPEGITAHLDRNHRWITEATAVAGSKNNDYTTVAPLAPLSQTEYLKYQEKIGVQDGVRIGWWLRTPRGENWATGQVLCIDTRPITQGKPAEVGAYANSGTLNVRPAFSLDGEFF